MNKKIGRLDVSMDNIFLMYFFEAITNLLQNINDFILGKFSSFAFNVVFKILFTIFKKEIQMFFGFCRFIKSKVSDKKYLTMLGLLSLSSIYISRLISSSFLMLSKGIVFTARSSDLLFFTYPRYTVPKHPYPSFMGVTT